MPTVGRVSQRVEADKDLSPLGSSPNGEYDDPLPRGATMPDGQARPGA